MNALAPVPCVSPGVSVLTTAFKVSGIYQPSPGLVGLIVECWGGGAGGGSVIAISTVTVAVGAGGGGSGGYSRKTLPASLVMGGVTVTVGAGGAAGANGAATSFGALCLANGGVAAQAVPEYSGVAGGGPAPPGIGDIAMAGASGGNGSVQYFTTTQAFGIGGGLGGAPSGGNVTFEVGPGGSSVGAESYANTGAGGGGAVVNQALTGSVLVGGTGGSGLCVVTEFCWSSGAPAGCGCSPARVSWTGGCWNDC